MKTLIICTMLTIYDMAPNTYWTDSEIKTMNKAKTRCQEIYPEAPCLKELHRVEPFVFRAVCGKEEK